MESEVRRDGEERGNLSTLPSRNSGLHSLPSPRSAASNHTYNFNNANNLGSVMNSASYTSSQANNFAPTVPPSTTSHVTTAQQQYPFFIHGYDINGADVTSDSQTTTSMKPPQPYQRSSHHSKLGVGASSANSSSASANTATSTLQHPPTQTSSAFSITSSSIPLETTSGTPAKPTQALFSSPHVKAVILSLWDFSSGPRAEQVWASSPFPPSTRRVNANKRARAESLNKRRTTPQNATESGATENSVSSASTTFQTTKKANGASNKGELPPTALMHHPLSISEHSALLPLSASLASGAISSSPSSTSPHSIIAPSTKVTKHIGNKSTTSSHGAAQSSSFGASPTASTSTPTSLSVGTPSLSSGMDVLSSSSDALSPQHDVESNVSSSPASTAPVFTSNPSSAIALDDESKYSHESHENEEDEEGLSQMIDEDYVAKKQPIRRTQSSSTNQQKVKRQPIVTSSHPRHAKTNPNANNGGDTTSNSVHIFPEDTASTSFDTSDATFITDGASNEMGHPQLSASVTENQAHNNLPAFSSSSSASQSQFAPEEEFNEGIAAESEAFDETEAETTAVAPNLHRSHSSASIASSDAWDSENDENDTDVEDQEARSDSEGDEHDFEENFASCPEDDIYDDEYDDDESTDSDVEDSSTQREHGDEAYFEDGTARWPADKYGRKKTSKEERKRAKRRRMYRRKKDAEKPFESGDVSLIANHVAKYTLGSDLAELVPTSSDKNGNNGGGIMMDPWNITNNASTSTSSSNASSSYNDSSSVNSSDTGIGINNGDGSASIAQHMSSTVVNIFGGDDDAFGSSKATTATASSSKGGANASGSSSQAGGAGNNNNSGAGDDPHLLQQQRLSQLSSNTGEDDDEAVSKLGVEHKVHVFEGASYFTLSAVFTAPYNVKISAPTASNASTAPSANMGDAWFGGTGVSGGQSGETGLPPAHASSSSSQLPNFSAEATKFSFSILMPTSSYEAFQRHEPALIDRLNQWVVLYVYLCQLRPQQALPLMHKEIVKQVTQLNRILACEGVPMPALAQTLFSSRLTQHLSESHASGKASGNNSSMTGSASNGANNGRGGISSASGASASASNNTPTSPNTPRALLLPGGMASPHAHFAHHGHPHVPASFSPSAGWYGLDSGTTSAMTSGDEVYGNQHYLASSPMGLSMLDTSGFASSSPNSSTSELPAFSPYTDFGSAIPTGNAGNQPDSGKWKLSTAAGALGGSGSHLRPGVSNSHLLPGQHPHYPNHQLTQMHQSQSAVQSGSSPFGFSPDVHAGKSPLAYSSSSAGLTHPHLPLQHPASALSGPSTYSPNFPFSPLDLPSSSGPGPSSIPQSSSNSNLTSTNTGANQNNGNNTMETDWKRTRDFLSLILTSHFQTHQRTVIMGDDIDLVNMYVATVALFLTPEDRLKSRYATFHNIPTHLGGRITNPHKTAMGGANAAAMGSKHAAAAASAANPTTFGAVGGMNHSTSGSSIASSSNSRSRKNSGESNTSHLGSQAAVPTSSRADSSAFTTASKLKVSRSTSQLSSLGGGDFSASDSSHATIASIVPLASGQASFPSTSSATSASAQGTTHASAANPAGAGASSTSSTATPAAPVSYSLHQLHQHFYNDGYLPELVLQGLHGNHKLVRNSAYIQASMPVTLVDLNRRIVTQTHPYHQFRLLRCEYHQAILYKLLRVKKTNLWNTQETLFQTVKEPSSFIRKLVLEAMRIPDSLVLPYIAIALKNIMARTYTLVKYVEGLEQGPRLLAPSSGSAPGNSTTGTMNGANAQADANTKQKRPRSGSNIFSSNSDSGAPSGASSAKASSGDGTSVATTNAGQNGATQAVSGATTATNLVPQPSNAYYSTGPSVPSHSDPYADLQFNDAQTSNSRYSAAALNASSASAAANNATTTSSDAVVAYEDDLEASVSSSSAQWNADFPSLSASTSLTSLFASPPPNIFHYHHHHLYQHNHASPTQTYGLALGDIRSNPSVLKRIRNDLDLDEPCFTVLLGLAELLKPGIFRALFGDPMSQEKKWIELFEGL